MGEIINLLKMWCQHGITQKEQGKGPGCGYSGLTFKDFCLRMGYTQEQHHQILHDLDMHTYMDTVEDYR